MKPMIKNLDSFGERGWGWDELDYNGEHYTAYQTNDRGEGLWIIYNYACQRQETKQIEGTCQFWLPKTKAGAYSKLRRLWIKKHCALAP